MKTLLTALFVLAITVAPAIAQESNKDDIALRNIIDNSFEVCETKFLGENITIDDPKMKECIDTQTDSAMIVYKVYVEELIGMEDSIGKTIIQAIVLECHHKNNLSGTPGQPIYDTIETLTCIRTKMDQTTGLIRGKKKE